MLTEHELLIQLERISGATREIISALQRISALLTVNVLTKTEVINEQQPVDPQSNVVSPGQHEGD